MSPVAVERTDCLPVYALLLLPKLDLLEAMGDFSSCLGTVDGGSRTLTGPYPFLPDMFAPLWDFASSLVY